MDPRPIASWRFSAVSVLVRSAASTFINLVFPGRCLRCGCQVDKQGGLCPTCWKTLSFISAPQCACCGVPFDLPAAPGVLCGSCLANPPVYARARAIWRYDEGSRPLILAFKHGDGTYAAPALGSWLARTGAELLAEADVCVPVPLHRGRLMSRRYNQSALLACRVAAYQSIRFAPGWLTRTRATQSQGGLDRDARRKNVHRAFAVSKAGCRHLPGLRVVLVDDVMTTGATVSACATTLLAAGARQVDVLTLARVV